MTKQRWDWCLLVATTLVVATLGSPFCSSALAAETSGAASVLSRGTLQDMWAAKDRETKGVDAVIEKFEVVDVDVPSAVARLANEQSVLCGIAVMAYPAPATPITARPLFKRVSAKFERATVREILDRLMALDPAFEWHEEAGVVNVALRPGLENPEYPLNAVIPKFAVNDIPWPIALYGWSPDWQVEPAPLLRLDWARGLPFSYAGSGPSRPPDYPRVTLRAENQTPLEILNEMARQLKLSWWLFDGRLIYAQANRFIQFRMGLKLPGTPKDAAAAPSPAPTR